MQITFHFNSTLTLLVFYEVELFPLILAIHPSLITLAILIFMHFTVFSHQDAQCFPFPSSISLVQWSGEISLFLIYGCVYFHDWF